jgi:signal transduction histidine kinase
MEKTRRQALVSWVSLGVLAALCGVLAVLQYRWIGAVSRAERERLAGDLQAALNRLSRDFNTGIRRASWSLIPPDDEISRVGREEAYAVRYRLWRSQGGSPRLFRRVALAVPGGRSLALRSLNLESGVFKPAEWPGGWRGFQEQLLARLRGPVPGGVYHEQPALFELPRFGHPQDPGGNGQFFAREQEWLVLELDLDYICGTHLPDLVERHLGARGNQGYELEVVMRMDPSITVCPSGTQRMGPQADAATTLLEVFPEPGFPPGALAARRRMLRENEAALPDAGRGRWLLQVRRRGDSLDAVVSRARKLNLGISATVLLLMLTTGALLIRFTRQTQRLAELQMNFVAGISHELRTPLAVIATAAYNLRGRVAHNLAHVGRYAELIQKETAKLTDIVEQVLQFAGARAGHVLRQRERMSVEALIEESLASSTAFLEDAHCEVEKRIEPGLPLVLGDPTALKQAIENLILNAVKHGTGREKWIGVFARSTRSENPGVEIRIADRGCGIPENERERIFDPFFRGDQAVRNQVHGTGLGLSLVKRIVEAHRGTITVESKPMEGAEFIVRIPAADGDAG